MSDRSPTMAEVIRNAVNKAVADFRVMLPAKVERFDASKGLVDVQPLLKEERTDENGDRVVEQLPVICNVPVQWFGAGPLAFVFDITKGATGSLIFCDRSLDIWIETGGVVDPLDARRHHLSDAVFIPGLNPVPGAVSVESGVMTIGSTSGTSQFVALANKVQAALDALKGHTHTCPNTGTSTPTPTSAAASGIDTNVASATVKVRG